MPPSPTFPRAQALVLASAKISEAIAICFVMPFVNQMVIGFGESPASAPKYAGLIDSALIVTESISAPVWGAASDRLGRKPLLILGLTAFALAAMGMGLAQNLWQAITARCISGILGAVGVLVRTVQFEITTSEHLGRVLETLAPCWAIGAAIGPMIGGGLAEPAETFPWLFKGTIFDRFPYLLPSIVAAVVPAGSALGYWFLVPETLGNPSAESSEPVVEDQLDETTSLLSTPRKMPKSMTNSKLVAELSRAFEQDQNGSESVSTWRMIMNPKLAYPLFCSALLSFVSMSYNAAFMMMASTSLEQGGLGLAPWQLGAMLGTSSCLGVLVATYVLPALEHRFGWYATLRITSFAHVLLFPLIILAGITARVEGGVGIWSTPVLALLLVSYEIGEVSFTPVDVAICDRAPTGRLGEVNGIAMSCQSFGRMAAPALSGQLWSWSIASDSGLGHNIIWIIFTLTAVAWHGTTYRLFSPSEIEARKSKRQLANLESGTASESTLLLTPRQSYGTFSTILRKVKRLGSIGRSSSTRSDSTEPYPPSPESGSDTGSSGRESASITGPLACNGRRPEIIPHRPGGYGPSFISRMAHALTPHQGSTGTWSVFGSSVATVPLPGSGPDVIVPVISQSLSNPPSTYIRPTPSRPMWIRQMSGMERDEQAWAQGQMEEARRDAFMASGTDTYIHVEPLGTPPHPPSCIVHNWIASMKRLTRLHPESALTAPMQDSA